MEVTKMVIRKGLLRTTLLWVSLAALFALCELTLPEPGDNDDTPEHSLNRPLVATRAEAREGIRR
jgi:hypothetical protein